MVQGLRESGPSHAPAEPEQGRLRADLTAAVTTALVTIPDGLASAVLAGLNPVYGLYALMVGTPLAAVLMSSQLMYVANTGALAVATGSALTGYTGEAQIAALVALTFLVGAIQLTLGLLRLGAITRFVSNAVMTGFMTGVMVRIILSQLGDLSGYKGAGGNPVMQAVDLARHVSQVHPPTVAVGLLAIGIIVGLGRTRLANYAMAAAVALASLAVALLGLDGVRVVADVAQIPGSLPGPTLPAPALLLELLPAAAAVALVGLVQAAGVSKTVPNPDGRYPNVSRDFAGQGAANLFASLFKGMPIGGTMSETAVNVGAGARSRWAAVYSGLLILAFVLLAGGLVEQIAKPAIAALLIVASVEAIRFGEIYDVWHTSLASRMVMVVTLAMTLALPVEQAVAIGVVLSIALHLWRASLDVQVLELKPTPDGDFEERPAPASLPDARVTVLNLYGSLFFAGADTLESMLPSARGARRAVVILRLRGRTNLGSTVFNVVERYGEQLRRGGGKLVLSGVSDTLYQQVERTGLLQELGAENVIRAIVRPGAAMRRAVAEAEAWLAREARPEGPARPFPDPVSAPPGGSE